MRNQQATKSFLSAGPPWPPGGDRAQFQPEDAYEALSRAFEILDSFHGCVPTQTTNAFVGSR